MPAQQSKAEKKPRVLQGQPMQFAVSHFALWKAGLMGILFPQTQGKGKTSAAAAHTVRTGIKHTEMYVWLLRKTLADLEMHGDQNSCATHTTNTKMTHMCDTHSPCTNISQICMVHVHHTFYTNMPYATHM